MTSELRLLLTPREAYQQEMLHTVVASRMGVERDSLKGILIRRRSLDARRTPVLVHVDLEAFVDNPFPGYSCYKPPVADVSKAEPVIIAGTGPAGIFAALTLIEHGRKPVLVERGREVSERMKDIAAIARISAIDPDSNYCFGEGGAGAFSDSKLYTRSKKKGDTGKVLDILYYHGAPESILYDSHPHIGTDLLPDIVRKIRNTILEAGGEFHFNTRLTDIIINDGQVRGIVTNRDEKIEAGRLILATGHSARDVYDLLHRKGLVLEMKGFAMGVRVEHPQELIDAIQYHGERNAWLPAAFYRMTARAAGRGVYTFCMCPGGFIVPSATSNGEVVVNGMSPSGRDSSFANSGVVVELRAPDMDSYKTNGVFAGLRFQQFMEKTACRYGGGGLIAPAQRLTDFMEGKMSTDLPATSYKPGVVSSPLHEWFPPVIRDSLRTGFRAFGQIMRGYYTAGAIVVGVESRSSSPVRIPRNGDSLEHPQVKGLYPAGEGAGYAGGIVSSAIDGMNCAIQACR